MTFTLPSLSPNQDPSAAIASLYLDRPTAKTRILASALSEKRSTYQPICQHLTRQNCAKAETEAAHQPSTSTKASSSNKVICQDGACDQVHFELIVLPQTDFSLGHCSYLNTCHKMHSCRYLHFKPIPAPNAPNFSFPNTSTSDEQFSQDPNSSSPEGSKSKLETDSDIKSSKHPVKILKELGLDNWVRDYQEFDSKEAFTSGEAEEPNLDQEKDDEEDLVPPAQWLNCDLKNFDYSILGKFDVIMADPPLPLRMFAAGDETAMSLTSNILFFSESWFSSSIAFAAFLEPRWDIHMSLPYETMTDNDMRSMPVNQLQDEGFIFLWVTGRALELGRELLGLWGYTRVDELIWVKVGQTQRLIRTGRTGHWLNHTKEHCLIGAKTSSQALTSTSIPSTSKIPSLSSPYQSSLPSGIPSSKILPFWSNVGLSSDVIVSEVRDTSRKPDEIYKLIERLCPGGRKVELFGRKTNTRKGWITLGNQLKGDYICESGLKDGVEDWRRRQKRH